MPGDGTLIFQNMPEMVEGEVDPRELWPDGDEWGVIPQADGGLGAIQTPGAYTSLPGYLGPPFQIPSGVSTGGATTGCTGSDWQSLGYPTKQAWKALGKSCAPYQGISQASCPPGFQIDPNSGQCMPIQPALPPPQVIPGTGGQAGQCQFIPAGTPGSCLSPISQGQIGVIPPSTPARSGPDVLGSLEGIWTAHSTLILIGVGLYLLWPTLTKRRR